MNRKFFFFLFMLLGTGRTQAEQSLTYATLQELGAARFLELAAARWDAKDPGGALVFARHAEEIRADIFGSADPRTAMVAVMSGKAEEMLQAEATDPAKAVLIMRTDELRERAAGGDLAASHELGVRFSYGLGGLSPSPAEAIPLLVAAVGTGRADSIFELGKAMRDQRVRSQMQAHWARRGPEPLPGTLLGDFDPREFQVFNDAFVKGNANAAAFVALGLIDQSIMARDTEAKSAGERGWQMLRKSAQDGNPWGQYLLAEALAQGFGIPATRKLAVEWAGKAAAQGLPEAQLLHAELILGDPASSGDEKSRREAWIDLYCAARQSNWLAFYGLGRRLAKGDGIEQDTASGLEWLGRASDEGCLPASAALRAAMNPAAQ